jgi:hypothetical protein
MAPRTVAAVVGLAFFLAGLVIMFLPLSVDSPTGLTISCGSSIGLGFDEAVVEKTDAAFVGICSRLRGERLTWAGPVAGLGAVFLVGAMLTGRRRSTA